jgi:hypothetical protein
VSFRSEATSRMKSHENQREIEKLPQRLGRAAHFGVPARRASEYSVSERVFQFGMAKKVTFLVGKSLRQAECLVIQYRFPLRFTCNCLKAGEFFPAEFIWNREGIVVHVALLAFVFRIS